MIAWINFAVLVFASLFFLYFYVLSVSPAARERLIGPAAYQACARDRLIAGGFEFITVFNYVAYFFFPLNTPLPQTFPWPWWVSALLAVALGVPTVYLMVLGMRHAGEETMRPKKEHRLYSGIYEKIRHPQAAGEVWGWLVIALFLHSPFLAIYSLVYFPIFLIMSWAEEHDLILRYGESYARYHRRTGAFFPHFRMEN